MLEGVGYTALETAVVSAMVNHFTDLTADVCKAGDLDGILEKMFTGDYKVGIVVEFGGGDNMTRKPMNANHWTWTMFCVMMIRYTDTIEADLRSYVDELKSLFSSDPRLGGLTPKASVVDIRTAETATINEIPFYWLPFIVEVIDR